MRVIVTQREFQLGGGEGGEQLRRMGRQIVGPNGAVGIEVFTGIIRVGHLKCDWRGE